MRMTRLQVGLLALFLIAILLPAAYTQFGGFGGGRGGRGGGPPGGGMGGRGGMRGMFNPDDMFNRMSNGADSIDVNTIELRQRGSETVEQQREKMMSFLQTKGVSNGKMTRELFREYLDNRMRDMTRGFAEKGFDGLAKGANSFDVDKVEITGWMAMGGSAERQKEQMKAFLKSKGINNNVMTKELYLEFTENRMKDFREKGDTRTEEEKRKDNEARARESFKQIDTNGDGSITIEEAQEAGKRGVFGDSIRERENFERFDANKNNKIEFDEFSNYINVRTQERQRRGEDGDGKTEDGGIAGRFQELDARPKVYRYGKLPSEIPSWFNENDGDKDAQVGLYEWKQAGKDVKEFLSMDSNGDGFLTSEEMIRFEKSKTKGLNLASALAASGQPQAIDPVVPARGFPPGGNGGDFMRPGGGDRRNGMGDRGRGGLGNGGMGKGDWGKGKMGKGDFGKGRRRRGGGDGEDRGRMGGGGRGGMGGGMFDPEKMKEFREKMGGKGKGGRGGRGKGGRGGGRPETPESDTPK